MTRASQQRAAANARIAWHRAHHTFVYIEGLAGVHTLQTGIVYYWRGHHIYSHPLGNLIEQIPFSTRQGIAIQGIVDNAPPYDGSAPGLVDEADVHALAASIFTEQEIQQEQQPPLPPPPPPAAPRPIGTPIRQGTASNQLLSPVAPNFQYTPRFGQDFLAASAPGSRIASPLPSPFRAQHGASSQRLRPSASMQRLTLPSITGTQLFDLPVDVLTGHSKLTPPALHAMRDSSLLQPHAEPTGGISSGTNTTSPLTRVRDTALRQHNAEAAEQASAAHGTGDLQHHALSEADQQRAGVAEDNPFLMQNAPYFEQGEEYDAVGAEWEVATEDSYSSGGTAIMSMVESRRRDIAEWASPVEERAWGRAGLASL
ncbi:hypothetical protein E8E13_011245 [Curvularia kusanoi]|uniref:Uncharacterized protein n=1 Tax=Curvularia kusanoi TaxID=90978 RepID=A0A9P4TMD1_CURKU|nr:hypothetical protein E8E13_011245 [Curvularia kusanoi]